MKLAFGGDVMLGRLVAQTMRELGPDYPLQAVAPLFRQSDLAIVNLECAVTANAARWAGPEKAFYFRADPSAAGALARAGIGAVSLANNHALDYGREGLVESLELLAREGIVAFGAGRDLEQALQPKVVRVGEHQIGLVGFTDHPAEFAARAHRAGVAFLDLEDAFDESVATVRRGIERSREAGADVVIVSLHWGPNFDGEPDAARIRFAHATMDAGADVLFGHSAHELQGIEVYHGRPILYGAGDLVDDYWVGHRENDRTMVYTLELEGSRPHRLELWPCMIESCRVAPAPEPVAREIAARVTGRSARLGTPVVRAGEHLYVPCG